MKHLFYVSALIVAALMATGCQSAPVKAEKNLLAPYEGKVLVMIMGMPGCGNTETTSEKLDAYYKNRPEGVEIVRVDVPPPGGKLKPLKSWSCAYKREVDRSRMLADKMGFFYYPTLYILDKDGDVRFNGEYNDEVPDHIKAILAEKSGTPKKQYSPMMLAEGQKPDAFSCADLAGTKRAFDDLRGKKATLVIFSSLTCPFSKKAVVSAPDLAKEFGSKGASVIVINRDAPADDIRSFYQEKMPEVPVLVDSDGKLSEDRFGVTAVPFCYVLDKNNAVSYKMPFTSEAAQGAMKATLGLTQGRFKVKSKGAG